MSDLHNMYNMLKKKKYRRKKKNPNLVTPSHSRPIIVNPDPAATLQGLKTIANLIQLHQQLSQNRSNQDPKPLMSGPRFGSRFGRQDFKETTGSMVTQNKRTETQEHDPIQAAGTSKSNETTQSNQSTIIDETNIDNNQNANSVNAGIKKENTTAQRPLSKNQVMKQNNKSRKTNQQFDDFEIYDSPSFINFDDSSEVVELNDDDLFQSKNISNDKKNTINVKKEFNFQKKIQQRFAKKMEIKSQEHPISAPTPIKSEQESSKKGNEELHEGVSADIRTVVQDNININIKIHQNVAPKYSMDEFMNKRERLPKGIPRSFLLQQSINQSQALKQFQSSNQENINNYNNSIKTKINESIENANHPQAYSPTDVYEETQDEEHREGSESPDALEPGQKRVSAFQRLGPLKQTKKPKLTINLCLNKDQDVREVLDVTKIDIPVHERDYIINSKNEIVLKYLPQWPWKRPVKIIKSVTARNSKTVMMLEKEQMEEIYEQDDIYIMILITGYPPTWTKENILDLILENLDKKSFIPCFIEHTTKECKLLVLRSRASLLAFHTLGFTVSRAGVELSLTVCETALSAARLDFVPRLALRGVLAARYDVRAGRMDLSAFTLDRDLSHFIYYPLHHPFNQLDLFKIHNDIQWKFLYELDLSDNNIESIENFHLETTTPNLKVLNLSNNRLKKALLLLPCRYMPLQKLYLQGNPLCLDYIDSEHYVRVLKTMFSTLKELDGVPIKVKGELPTFKKNYIVEEAHTVVSKFLEIFFPLLECEAEDRNMKNLYTKNTVLTITCRNKLRYDANKNIRNLLIKSQSLLEGNLDQVEGASNIEKLIKKWPNIQHDPSTFTVDVIFHDEHSTIIKITGIFKIIANTLAEDEPVLAFSRNIHLATKNGYHYKILNEMIYWDVPTAEYADSAFKTVMIPKKELSLKFETVPDEECKKRLVRTFMAITELEENASEKCLETKGWHFQHALEYFVKLLKLDDLQSLVT